MPRKTHLPRHLTSTELKRRVSALMKAAQDHGFEIGGVRLDADGEITLLDKSSQLRDPDAETKWLGT